MKEEVMKKNQKETVYRLADLKGIMPTLFGIRSGVEGLDSLFYTTEFDGEKVTTRPLGGYPARGVLQITGTPDTGKSLMAEQFLVQQASMGYPVCLVTTEQSAAFSALGLKQRAMAMGIPFEKIEKNIVIIDAASQTLFREDLPSLLEAMAKAIQTYGIKSTVIDSVTGLYESREMLARQTVRQIYHFLKKWNQTALLISQKRSGHEELTSEAAGGYAVAHIVDGTLVVSKKEILRNSEVSLYKKPLGETVRLFRIDGCRLCGHDSSVHLFEIDRNGLVKVGPSLQELVQQK